MNLLLHIATRIIGHANKANGIEVKGSFTINLQDMNQTHNKFTINNQQQQQKASREMSFVLFLEIYLTWVKFSFSPASTNSTQVSRSHEQTQRQNFDSPVKIKPTHKLLHVCLSSKCDNVLQEHCKAPLRSYL